MSFVPMKKVDTESAGRWHSASAYCTRRRSVICGSTNADYFFSLLNDLATMHSSKNVVEQGWGLEVDTALCDFSFSGGKDFTAIKGSVQFIGKIDPSRLRRYGPW